MPNDFKEPRKVSARVGSRVITFLTSRLLPPHCLLLPQSSPRCSETTGSNTVGDRTVQAPSLAILASPLTPSLSRESTGEVDVGQPRDGTSHTSHNTAAERAPVPKVHPTEHQWSFEGRYI